MDADLDFDDALSRGLLRYVMAVAAELGLAGECSCADPGPPATAYLAVDGRVPSFPDRDLALLWDEEYGWAAAVETGDCQAPVVLAYLGGEVLPATSAVAAFVAALLCGGHPGDPRPVRLRVFGAADGLVERVCDYPR